MRTVTLNNGVEMPVLGFGVYQVNEPGECERAVGEALDVGYRLIDTAAAYGNEEEVGRAIAASDVPREEVFLTTKVWVNQAGDDATERACERSLQRLGVDHLDLYLIHQPFGDYYGAWRAMQRLLADGRVRAIGVSNFYPDRLADLALHHEVVPQVNQIETHPFFQRGEDAELMRELGVQHQSWGPFAEGKHDLFTDPTLSSIAAAHERTVAQVVLRWLVQREVVAIPKSVRRERMAENFAVFDFELSDDDLATLAGLDTGASAFFDHRSVWAARTLGGAAVE